MEAARGPELKQRLMKMRLSWYVFFFSGLLKSDQTLLCLAAYAGLSFHLGLRTIHWLIASC